VSEGTIDALWFLARGTGVTALVLLTIAVALGIGTRSGRPAFGLPRFGVADVHRNVSLMAIGLVLVHMIGLLLDPYAQLEVFDLVVPFGATYRPLWVGLGTLAADLLILTVVTSLLRHRLGLRTWRTLHWATYALWPAAWLHGVFTGTDGEEPWLIGTAVVCAAIVAGALVWRFSARFSESTARRQA
jgi:methionine sulfoxide reductase heme-binding subunit